MYECHITLYGDRKAIEKKVKALHLDWHFSAIDGDPDLGEGVKCYLTKHYSEVHKLEAIISQMTTVANYLKGFDLCPIRKKIEVIIYDQHY